MIGRVRDRATFEALRRRGRRVRQGPVTVVHLPAPPASGAMPSEPSVRAAYGIGRKVGNAVVRNRVRRRLRAILRELDREGPGREGEDAAAGGLVPGTYLVTVRPEAASLPYAELERHVTTACAAVGRRDDPSRVTATSGAAAARRRAR